jgi:uncharacterized protein
VSGALAGNLVAFGRALRAAGLAVTPEQTRLFARGLERVGAGNRRDVRAAGRVIYARSREEVRLFDHAFDLFWQRGAAGEEPGVRPARMERDRRAPPQPVAGADEPVTDALAPEVPWRRGADSADRVRHRDFAELTPEEARDALAMIERLAPRIPMRGSRRQRLGRHGNRLAMRAMLRRSLGTGGETLAWRWFRATERPRPLVLVCDISGSMETYTRFLLRFAHALRGTRAPVEVFVFGTRLTRITRELRHRDPDEALRRAAARVQDWNGGTRIGASLGELNRRWVRRAVRSSAVVLIVSDGWERDDPARLGEEMARLRRACHRLIWLNPLAGQPGFEPATGGLVAALPHVDAFLACGSVATLEGLGRRLGSLVGGEHATYQA